VTLVYLVLGQANGGVPTGRELLPRALTASEVKQNSVIELQALVVEEQKQEEREDMSTITVGKTGAGEMSKVTNAISGQSHLSLAPQGTNESPDLSKDMVRMPGTKWCGPGWRTDTANKVGGYASADRCCRQHDLGCPLSIEPGATKWQLTNDGFHTGMHCSCDERFRSCLKMARTAAADIVGNIFFNLGKTRCFVFTKKKVCPRRNWWGRCLGERKVELMAEWRTPRPYTH